MLLFVETLQESVGVTTSTVCLELSSFIKRVYLSRKERLSRFRCIIKEKIDSPPSFDFGELQASCYTRIFNFIHVAESEGIDSASCESLEVIYSILSSSVLTVMELSPLSCASALMRGKPNTKYDTQKKGKVVPSTIFGMTKVEGNFRKSD